MLSVPLRPDWHRYMVVIAAADGFRLDVAARCRSIRAGPASRSSTGGGFRSASSTWSRSGSSSASAASRCSSSASRGAVLFLIGLSPASPRWCSASGTASASGPCSTWSRRWSSAASCSSGSASLGEMIAGHAGGDPRSRPRPGSPGKTRRPGLSGAGRLPHPQLSPLGRATSRAPFSRPSPRALARRGVSVRVVAPERSGAGRRGGARRHPGAPGALRLGSGPRPWPTGEPCRRRSGRPPVWARWPVSGARCGAPRARKPPPGAELFHAHWWVPGGLALPKGTPSVLTVHGTDAALLRRSRIARTLARPVFQRATRRDRGVPRAGRVGTDRRRALRGRRLTCSRCRWTAAAIPWSGGGGGAVVIARLIAAEAGGPGDRDRRLPGLLRPRAPAHGRRRRSRARRAGAPGRAARRRPVRPLRRRGRLAPRCRLPGAGGPHDLSGSGRGLRTGRRGGVDGGRARWWRAGTAAACWTWCRRVGAGRLTLPAPEAMGDADSRPARRARPAATWRGWWENRGGPGSTPTTSPRSARDGIARPWVGDRRIRLAAVDPRARDRRLRRPVAGAELGRAAGAAARLEHRAGLAPPERGRRLADVRAPDRGVAADALGVGTGTRPLVRRPDLDGLQPGEVSPGKGLGGRGDGGDGAAGRHRRRARHRIGGHPPGAGDRHRCGGRRRSPGGARSEPRIPARSRDSSCCSRPRSPASGCCSGRRW